MSLIKKDTASLIHSLSMLSIAEFSLGAYHESKKSAIIALKLTDESKTDEWTSKVIVGLYNSLGKAHRELNDYEKAIESYDNVLRLCQNLGDSIAAYNNKAVVYKDEGNFNLALSELSTAYRLSFRNPKATQNARVLDNLGYVQFKLNNSEGIKNIFKALDIRASENDLEGIFSSYNSLIEFYNEKEDKDSVQIYAYKALDLSKKINSPTFRKQALLNLLKLEENPWFVEYIEIENELTERKLEQDVKYSHAKYDIEKERRKTLQIEEEKKIQYLIFIGIGLLLLISAMFLFFLLKIKHKREKSKEVIRETYQTERRLSKKVHDELANDMSDTLNYVDNHKEIPIPVKTHLVNKLDELYDRTRDISAEIDGFDNKDFASSLKFLITQHNREGVKVITNVTSGINWDTVSDHKKINVYRSLQELLVNMKKHSKATKVTVIFKSEGKKHFINYTDNGIGTEIENVHLRGLQNAETRIKNIGGSITFNSSKGNGFKATFIF
ncbi:tetratricopeptide repeat-containing sensor histidine kinase [uncultured Dokdonia sp.]|uniref:tetratricopeptide repeat-containing sensor histidine kinase n=1 Tax=uncultured Dokdonia sp. TaxID=575653 RepID=UPI0026351F7E|nr:tetratricopeptide repeat-containing sensor histidine kinase [uncultured Dokdonia sp.]